MKQYRLTIESHPERTYERWLFLSRGKGRPKLAIAPWMTGTISAHPHHSAHDISMESSAQLLKQEDSGTLYVMVFQVQSRQDQSETISRCFRIVESSNDLKVEEAPLAEAPEAMTVISSI